MLIGEATVGPNPVKVNLPGVAPGYDMVRKGGGVSPRREPSHEGGIPRVGVA